MGHPAVVVVGRPARGECRDRQCSSISRGRGSSSSSKGRHPRDPGSSSSTQASAHREEAPHQVDRHPLGSNSSSHSGVADLAHSNLVHHNTMVVPTQDRLPGWCHQACLLPQEASSSSSSSSRGHHHHHKEGSRAATRTRSCMASHSSSPSRGSRVTSCRLACCAGHQPTGRRFDMALYGRHVLRSYERECVGVSMCCATIAERVVLAHTRMIDC